MILLIDENLPPTIAQGCCESVHALVLGRRPTDTNLWHTAKAKGWTILSKDTDFFNRMVSLGPPPKVIWMRVGIMRRCNLEVYFKECWPTISNLLESYDLIEVFSDRIEALSFSRE